MRPTAPWRILTSAACLVLGGATSAGAAGAQPWLSARGSPRCSVHPEALAARVASAVIGDVDPELRVAVVLHDAGHNTRATLLLSTGARELGRRRLVASGCDEALEAVVAVTALALSSAASSASEAAPVRAGHDEPEPPAAGVAREQPLAGAAPAAAVREPATPEDVSTSSEPGSSPAGSSLVLATGAEVVGRDGAVSLAAGVALRSGGGVWRGQLRYGLPSLLDEEEALPPRSLKSRSERAAAAVDYCRDLDSGGWLAACGGLELGVIHRWRAEALEGEGRIERRWFEPWLAAVLGARLSYRRARWQPGLELSTLLPVVGVADTPRLGLRAQAGVVVPF